MAWQSIIAVRFLIANLLYPIYVKKIADLPAKSWQQFWMYFFCSIFSAIFILKGSVTFSYSLLIIFLLGAVNSIAVYCNFRAVNVSLSKTSVLTPLSAVFALALGYIFLNEIKYLNPLLAAGILSCFFSSFLLIFSGKRKKEEMKIQNKRFFLWIAGLSVIWGMVSFFMRYFALGGVTSKEFLISWYPGACLGSLLLLIPARKHETFKRLSPVNIFNLFLLALLIWLSFLLSYSASKIAPITVTEPIFLISAMIAPIVIGLFIFKEYKKFSTREFAALFIGCAGGLVIALNYN